MGGADLRTLGRARGRYPDCLNVGGFCAAFLSLASNLIACCSSFRLLLRRVNTKLVAWKNKSLFSYGSGVSSLKWVSPGWNQGLCGAAPSCHARGGRARGSSLLCRACPSDSGPLLAWPHPPPHSDPPASLL